MDSGRTAGPAQHAEARAMRVVERDFAIRFGHRRAQVETGIVRQQGAGHHARRGLALLNQPVKELRNRAVF